MNQPQPHLPAEPNLPAAIPAEQLDELIDLIKRDPESLAHAVAALAPDHVRDDGWTPFSRKLFLSVLADSGRVSLACEYTGLSRQSAYALRARDQLFAAGWDAACELARAPLADALYERALDGTVETITRNGEVVAERHRHDNRLSIAVLNRLDKRCDRAEERGARHLALVGCWEEWLSRIGKGGEASAMALLDAAGPNAPHCQACQLAESANPTGEAGDGADADAEEEPIDLSDSCWQDDQKRWMTNFPPPAGFDGYENYPYFDPHPTEAYERDCTPEESAILAADQERSKQAVLDEDGELRDYWFDHLRRQAAPDANADEGGADKGDADDGGESNLTNAVADSEHNNEVSG